MGVIDRSDTVLVIGAGPCGLVATKNLRERGHEVLCVDRFDDIGGNWNIDNPASVVYPSTHFISSKPFTEFPDFPMPDSYPDYPHHSRYLEYLRRYASHFGITADLATGTEVTRTQPIADSTGETRWRVTSRVSGGAEEVADFGALVIANGHNWFPKVPDYEGLRDFTGEVLHSAAYRGPEQLAGRRVLVVGGGNTGCDLAVEAAQHASVVFHSTRRGYWYTPKYAQGRPSDQIADLLNWMRLPLRVRQEIIKLQLRMTLGSYRRHGLAEPDHRPLESHPVVNSLLTYYVGQGDIVPRPDVRRFVGGDVEFADGARSAVDLVILCTGYLPAFPFLDTVHLGWTGGRPHLLHRLFSPVHDTLSVVGLLQPDSALMALAHWQTVAVAEYLNLRRARPERAARYFERLRATSSEYRGGVLHAQATRHWFEVSHASYIRGLAKLVRELETANAHVAARGSLTVLSGGPA